MPGEVWKDRDVAAAFLNERSLLIPDRERQLDLLVRVHRWAEGVAVDFSPLMLEQGRERLAPFGPRAVTAEADPQSPAWRDSVRGPFDGVVSGFTIHHLSHERKRAAACGRSASATWTASGSTSSWRSSAGRGEPAA
jgi:hypothetical protein